MNNDNTNKNIGNNIKENISNNSNEETTDNRESKKYNLKNDVIFKAFFAKRGNEQFLIDFLSSLLKIEIKEISIEEEVDLLRLTNDEKGGRIDLQAKLGDGTIVSIEMQVENEGNMEKRTDFYGIELVKKETEKGTSYENINKAIVVAILNFNILKGIPDYVSSTVEVLDKHRDYEVDSLITRYFVELPKFRKQNPDMNDKLNQWLAIIDDMNKGWIKMAEEKNETIKSALDEIGKLTGDAEVRRMAELHERWERDRISAIEYATKKGEEKGEKRGEKRGRKEEKLETARKLIENNVDIEIIIDATGLTKEEILKLKD